MLCVRVFEIFFHEQREPSKRIKPTKLELSGCAYSSRCVHEDERQHTYKYSGYTYARTHSNGIEKEKRRERLVLYFLVMKKTKSKKDKKNLKSEKYGL